jgi:hypothetical protein
MALTREQLKQSLINNITDALTRQNTAEIIRDELGKIIDNCFNLADDDSIEDYSHVQNTDQYLDEGGDNEVSAADLKLALTSTEYDLDGSILSQTWKSQSGDYKFKITRDDSGTEQIEEI